ncbi:MAG: methyl-accepting chemotaxis protein, partial [Lachnospiraceae bacterium]|nr:methyl-accepting chemotaxis protein [Lachnospiraceae bacterium]
MQVQDPDTKKSNRSYGDDIVRMIWTIFGLAIFIACIACLTVLYVTAQDRKDYIFNSAIIIGCFLVVYVIFSLYFVGKVKAAFEPLDRLLNENGAGFRSSNGLASLARDISYSHERLENMEKELDDTRKNLEDISDKNEETISTVDGVASNIVTILDARSREIKNMAGLFEKENTLLADMEMSATKIKEGQGLTPHRTDIIKKSVNDCNLYCEDTVADLTDAKNAHEVLKDMLDKSQNMMDDIYSELTLLQSMCSQINLYAMNTALDASRSGGYSLSVTAALDEIKEMSGRLNEKSDNLALLIIQEKNAIRLAFDQAEFGDGEIENGLKSFNQARGQIKTISDEADRLVKSFDELMDNVYSLTGFTAELYAYNGKKT